MSGRALVLSAAALLASCTAPGDEPFRARILAMATWVEIVVPPGETDGPGLATAAERMLRDFERDYYAWGDGELARLNATLSRGETFEASPELAALLATAKRLSAASDGAFDPGIGPLVELWGFNDAEHAADEPPAPAAVAAHLVGLARMADVEIAGRRVGTAKRTVTLDLGGIAKGEVVDRIVALMRARGIANAMVDAGGDLRVVGRPPGRHWRVGIRAPRAPEIIGVVELEDGEAAFTSGDYERYFEIDGTRAHHLLDPRTGYPAVHTQAVTVIADDGVTADAAATALFVAGPDAWPEVARRLGIRAVLRVDATGRIEMTAAMRERIQIGDGSASDIIVVNL